MAVVLTLDLSTRTGWAVGTEDRIVDHGVWAIGAETHGECGSRLAAALELAIEKHGPDEVVFEAPLPAKKQVNNFVATLLIGLAFVVRMVCFEQGVRCLEANVQKVRGLVLGNGHAQKADVALWCQAMGLKPYDDNDADAIAIWAYRLISQGFRLPRRAA